MLGDMDWGPLQAFLAEEEAADRFSGVVAVEHRGETVFAHAVGPSHVDDGIRNTLDTRFDVASITKLFTTVAVLQLVAQGAVSTDATVAELLPDVDIGAADRITIDHLLSHRSGLGDYWNARCWARRSTLRTTADYLALLDGERPAFDPGTVAAYGNSGFVLLGAIVEQVSGGDYYEVVRRGVAQRAGAVGAQHLVLDQLGPKDGEVAVGYTHALDWTGTVDPERRRPNRSLYPVRGSAATGMFASAGDLVRFGLALRNGDLLDATWVARMVGEGEGPGGAGYGTQRVPYSLGTAVGHGGRAFGAATCLLFLPEVEASVCILSNYDRPADKRVFEAVDRLIGAHVR